MGSMAMYQMVADWGNEKLPAERMSQGIFALALGSVLGGIVGGFSTIVYPDNIGMLRATRVGSRYATLAAGILLIALGGFVKFDMLLVLVPQPVVSAAATLLFGIVFMHGRADAGQGRLGRPEIHRRGSCDSGGPGRPLRFSRGHAGHAADVEAPARSNR